MKYIIEINDTPMTTPELGKKLYKAKGFNSLVFDQNGLDKLEKIDTYSKTEEYSIGYRVGLDKGYQEGYDTAIENAQATKLDWGEVQYKKGIEDLSHAMLVYEDTSAEERLEYYGTNIWAYQYAIDNPTELIAMVKAYEEKKKAEEETIKVGDVVRYNKKCHQYDLVKDREYLVLHVFDNDTCSLLYDNGDTCCSSLSILEPTGRHIDEVSQVLDKLLEKD